MLGHVARPWIPDSGIKYNPGVVHGRRYARISVFSLSVLWLCTRIAKVLGPPISDKNGKYTPFAAEFVMSFGAGGRNKNDFHLPLLNSPSLYYDNHPRAPWPGQLDVCIPHRFAVILRLPGITYETIALRPTRIIIYRHAGISSPPSLQWTVQYRPTVTKSRTVRKWYFNNILCPQISFRINK